MKKIRFIVNPISGVGRQRVIESMVDQHLDQQVYTPDLVYTEAAGHATVLAREAAEEGIDVVVAVGGDGSVNEVGKGLIQTNSAMGIVPAGSGNGLARHLGIPTDLAGAVRVLNQGGTTRIDTGTMNGIPFLGVAGIGFDAHIGMAFSKFGKRGFGSYIQVVMKEYPRYKAQQYHLTIDGKKLTKKAFLVCFANSSQYGNNAFISPGADIKDGLFDICILRPFSYIQMPWLLTRLFNGTMDRSPFMQVLKGKEIVVESPSNLLHLDGEPVELTGPLTVKMHPLSLQIVV